MKTGRCGGQAFVPGHPQPLQMGGGVPERNLLAQVQVHMLRTRPRDVLGEILIGQSQSESTWLPALRPRTQSLTGQSFLGLGPQSHRLWGPVPKAHGSQEKPQGSWGYRRSRVPIPHWCLPPATSHLQLSKCPSVIPGPLRVPPETTAGGHHSPL